MALVHVIDGWFAGQSVKKGYTAQAVTGFRGRSGRSFRAHLALSQTDEGKWRVEFDEPWAKEGAKAPEAAPEADELAAAKSKPDSAASVKQRSAA